MIKRIFSGSILRIAVVLLGCVVVASTASAFEGRGRHHGKKGGECGFGFLNQLDLTTAQKSGISAIMEKYEPQLDALRGDIHEARRQMRATTSQAPFDEAQVRAAYRERGPLHEDMVVLRAKMKDEIRSQLTADQIKVLEEKRDSWCERGREHGNQCRARIKERLATDADTDTTP